MEYVITEKQNLQSYRDGEVIVAKNLTAAKRSASRNRGFLGTVLTIEENGVLLAYKKGEKWTDIDLFMELREELREQYDRKNVFSQSLERR